MPMTTRDRLAICCSMLMAVGLASPAAAQVVAKVAAGTPAWSAGIVPITAESYWHAVDCGKKGGANPGCVFWDADMCKNDEFALAWYTPYKQVAYTVWLAVSRKQEPPEPNFQSAKRAKIVLGIKPLHAKDNPIVSVSVKRGPKAIPPETKTLDGNGGGSFYFDFPAFRLGATPAVIELVGKSKTITCTINRANLARMR